MSLKGDALKRSLRNHIIQLVITLQAKAKSFDDFSTYMSASLSAVMNLKRFQLLHFGSQTLVELHACETNEDVRMYT